MGPRRLKAVVTSLAIALVAGCSSASRIPVAPPAQPAAATAGHGTGTLTFTVTIPTAAASSSAQRSPAYVSGSAQSIQINVYTVTAGVISGVPASTSNQDLTATSPGCSGASPNVCSISVTAPIGIDAFGMTLYASTGEGGAVLSQLDPTAATERTISEGANNVVIPLILNGVPASLTVSAPATTFHGGVAASIAYTVVAKDAAGNIIIGAAPYETAITPTASDSNAFSFSPSTITSPTTAVTLQFNGNATAVAPTFGASVGAINATPIALAFSPGALSIACSSGCSGLANGNTPYALTVTEPGSGSVTPTVTGSHCTVDPASPSAAVLSGGSGTVNVYPNPVGGTCTVTVTDAYSQTATATTTFNATGNPIIVSGCLASTLPPDPNGGFLYVFNGCPTAGVMYGSYYFEPLQSNENPGNFQLAVYANPSKPYVTQFTVGGTEYITGATISSPYVVYQGDAGLGWPAINFPFTSFVP